MLLNRRKFRVWQRKNKSLFIGIAGMLVFLLILGLAGNSDYQSCLKGVC